MGAKEIVVADAWVICKFCGGRHQLKRGFDAPVYWCGATLQKLLVGDEVEYDDKSTGGTEMVCFSETILIEFMNNTKPTQFGYRVADFYDWLGRKSRIPSYYKMKGVRFQFEKDKLADKIDRRLFNEFRIRYVEWVRTVFHPFLSRNREKVIEAVNGSWGFVIFFRYQNNMGGKG